MNSLNKQIEQKRQELKTLENQRESEITNINNENACVSNLGLLCMNCKSTNINTEWIDHSFPYGRGCSAIELTARVPIRICLECGEKWLDYVAENLIQEEINSHTSEKL